jgi:hypothetical protein
MKSFYNQAKKKNYIVKEGTFAFEKKGKILVYN